MASLYILVSIFLWSSLGLVVRTSGIQEHLLIFYSCIISMAVQAPFLLKKFRGELTDLGIIKYPAILGVVGLLNTFSYYYAFTHTTIANAVLTHYTAPVIVAFLAPVFLKESITLRIAAAIAVATAGLLVMMNGFSFQEGHAIGLSAGLVSGFAYAVIIILARIYTQDIHPLLLTFFQNAVIALLLLPFIGEFPLHAWKSILFMGVIHSTIAPVLYYKGLRSVTANRAAVLGYLEPVSAIIFSVIFLHEQPGIFSVAGGMMIIFSGYLTVTGGRSVVRGESSVT